MLPLKDKAGSLSCQQTEALKKEASQCLIHPQTSTQISSNTKEKKKKHKQNRSINTSRHHRVWSASNGLEALEKKKKKDEWWESERRCDRSSAGCVKHEKTNTQITTTGRCAGDYDVCMPRANVGAKQCEADARPSPTCRPFQRADAVAPNARGRRPIETAADL